ncbi:hypothetical protein CSB45_03680 [candidate division KSB3 bacterium]|uniref:ABC transporter ATP-binding protein n=1 Tax=candidate division KSB3 bacterium TaxID=2044937 RepID=A0A2G6E978_9BACT|nr:MAG: hypothetical protein CSB45_03680 [candidate division KSB3 bacterium]PIE29594.1 MAG: hypothetical protein CSA57_08275 [candidate division KSB3 bacterium]
MKQLGTLLLLLKGHAVELSIGFCFMLSQNYGFMKTPMYMQKVVDALTGHNSRSLILHDLWMIVVYTALTVVSMFLMRKLIISVSRKMEYELRDRIYRKLLTLNMRFFLEHETGDLVSRCTNDLNKVRFLLGPGIMYIPNSLSRLLMFFPLLLSLNAPLLATVVLIIAAIVGLIFGFVPRLRPLFKSMQDYIGVINSRVWQVVSGITTIKLYALEHIEIERFKRLNEEYIRRHMAIVKTRGLLWPLLIFVFSFTELLMLLIGGREVIQQKMSLGQLLQFKVMIAQLSMPVLSLGWVLPLIQQGIAAMGRISHILDYAVEERDDWINVDSSELCFRAEGLSFRYPSGKKTSSETPAEQLKMRSNHQASPDRDNVLKDLNFRIPAGQFIGITGTIGSGKSTLIKLISGLFTPQRGMLFVNDIDICDIEPGSLLNSISVVPQKTFLFSRSIAENIALGMDGSIDLEQVKNAAQNAGLAQEIQHFPEQYDQILGERGITLSGGQKQRTAIARALMKQSPVLIFDDALSSVDAKTESHILDKLSSLHSFSTLIVISHRISALKNADTIYVLDKGRIVEEGTHEELLARQQLYARLARLQHMETELA